MEPLIESLNYILQNIINALQRGSFYAVISIGYSMVYGVLMLFNFAHGDIFMVGTYIGFGIATVFLATLTGLVPAPLIFLATVLVTMFLLPGSGCLWKWPGTDPFARHPGRPPPSPA